MDGREKNDRGESPYHVLGERPGAVVAPPGDLRAPRGVPRGGHGARGRDRSERSASSSRERGERCVRLPVAVAAEGTGKPCHRSDKNPRASAAHADFQRPGSGHRSGRAPAAAVRFVAFRGPNGLGWPSDFLHYFFLPSCPLNQWSSHLGHFSIGSTFVDHRIVFYNTKIFTPFQNSDHLSLF